MIPQKIPQVISIEPIFFLLLFPRWYTSISKWYTPFLDDSPRWYFLPYYTADDDLDNTPDDALPPDDIPRKNPHTRLYPPDDARDDTPRWCCPTRWYPQTITSHQMIPSRWYSRWYPPMMLKMIPLNDILRQYPDDIPDDTPDDTPYDTPQLYSSMIPQMIN
jgi:hypothetical protein